MTLSGLPSLDAPVEIACDVVLLPARGSNEQMLSPLHRIIASSPWRHMTVPGGKKMSVANTNCGERGWTSDKNGYCYRRTDPLTGLPWPPIPQSWKILANAWADEAGFTQGLNPDACLINGYAIGAKMSAHQDRDERNMHWPIVSLSLGAPARFVMGGPGRNDKGTAVMLAPGDVLVWGGSARLNFHGVGVPRRTPKLNSDGSSLPFPRLNFTFRRAA